MRGKLTGDIIMVLENILGVNLSAYEVSEISPANIEEWDSLNHLNIIMALEEEYDIKFAPESILGMLEGCEIICEEVNKLI